MKNRRDKQSMDDAWKIYSTLLFGAPTHAALAATPVTPLGCVSPQGMAHDWGSYCGSKILNDTAAGDESLRTSLNVVAFNLRRQHLYDHANFLEAFFETAIAENRQQVSGCMSCRQHHGHGSLWPVATSTVLELLPKLERVDTFRGAGLSDIIIGSSMPCAMIPTNEATLVDVRTIFRRFETKRGESLTSSSSSAMLLHEYGGEREGFIFRRGSRWNMSLLEPQSGSVAGGESPDGDEGCGGDKIYYNGHRRGYELAADFVGTCDALKEANKTEDMVEREVVLPSENVAYGDSRFIDSSLSFSSRSWMPQPCHSRQLHVLESPHSIDSIKKKCAFSGRTFSSSTPSLDLTAANSFFRFGALSAKGLTFVSSASFFRARPFHRRSGIQDDVDRSTGACSAAFSFFFADGGFSSLKCTDRCGKDFPLVTSQCGEEGAATSKRHIDDHKYKDDGFAAITLGSDNRSILEPTKSDLFGALQRRRLSRSSASFRKIELALSLPELPLLDTTGAASFSSSPPLSTSTFSAVTIKRRNSLRHQALWLLPPLELASSFLCPPWLRRRAIGWDRRAAEAEAENGHRITSTTSFAESPPQQHPLRSFSPVPAAPLLAVHESTACSFDICLRARSEHELNRCCIARTFQVPDLARLAMQVLGGTPVPPFVVRVPATVTISERRMKPIRKNLRPVTATIQNWRLVVADVAVASCRAPGLSAKAISEALRHFAIAGTATLRLDAFVHRFEGPAINKGAGKANEVALGCDNAAHGQVLQATARAAAKLLATFRLNLMGIQASLGLDGNGPGGSGASSNGGREAEGSGGGQSEQAVVGKVDIADRVASIDGAARGVRLSSSLPSRKQEWGRLPRWRVRNNGQPNDDRPALLSLAMVLVETRALRRAIVRLASICGCDTLTPSYTWNANYSSLLRPSRGSVRGMAFSSPDTTATSNATVIPATASTTLPLLQPCDAFEGFPRGAALLSYLYVRAVAEEEQEESHDLSICRTPSSEETSGRWRIQVNQQPPKSLDAVQAATWRGGKGAQQQLPSRLATVLFCSALEPYQWLLSEWLFAGAVTLSQDPAREFPIATRQISHYSHYCRHHRQNSWGRQLLLHKDSGDFFFQHAFTFAYDDDASSSDACCGDRGSRSGNGITDSLIAAQRVLHLLPKFLQGRAGLHLLYSGMVLHLVALANVDIYRSISLQRRQNQYNHNQQVTSSGLPPSPSSSSLLSDAASSLLVFGYPKAAAELCKVIDDNAVVVEETQRRRLVALEKSEVTRLQRWQLAAVAAAAAREVQRRLKAAVQRAERRATQEQQRRRLDEQKEVNGRLLQAALAESAEIEAKLEAVGASVSGRTSE